MIQMTPIDGPRSERPPRVAAAAAHRDADEAQLPNGAPLASSELLFIDSAVRRGERATHGQW